MAIGILVAMLLLGAVVVILHRGDVKLDSTSSPAMIAIATSRVQIAMIGTVLFVVALGGLIGLLVEAL